MKKYLAVKNYVIIVIFLFCLFTGPGAFAQTLNFVYKGGEEGYKCYRIPAIVKTQKGTLLAFAEARRDDCEDYGDIDLVVKRSNDGGKTWGKLELVWSDGGNTCGNPAPIVDVKTGNIVLLATWNLGTDTEKTIVAGTSKDIRRVFLLNSSDDGHTWSAAKDISSSVRKDNWTWYATGPHSAIQVTRGKYKGRMVVPCDHLEAESKKSFSHAIFSDDAGKTWQLGGTSPEDKMNESTVAELPNGDLMLNMRNYSDVRNRQVAISKDGGASWSGLYADSALIEPVCQASLIQYSFPGRKKLMVFSNPASKTSRTAMTVRISHDNGKTWPLKKLLYSGPVAYSNLIVLASGNLACFYEAGYHYRYEGIVFDEIRLSDFVKNEE